MVEDPKWELAILATVQGFYEKLLQESVRGEVPVPAGLEAISLQSDDSVLETLSAMHRWLRLLDLAITPAMLRRAFTPDTDPEIAEAMLRYFTRNRETSELHRDKTDLVTTFLYRHPRVPGQWERRGYGLDGALPLSPFEIALLEILADADVPELTDEHMQTLRLFDHLQQEAENFRDLNALLESGIIPRVRELKLSLDTSFYHPGALATIAPYNTAFGKKFDDLFHQSTAEIKNFAEVVEEQGGSILGNVDGVDVTVETEPGPVYTLERVSFTGAEAPNQPFLKLANIKTGQTANFDDVRAGQERIAQSMKRAGYLQATSQVKRDIDDKEHKLSITIDVNSGELYTLGKLNIVGLDIESEPVIRKMWTIDPGKPFNAEYPDHFLDRVKSGGVFDNLKTTRSETKVNDAAHTVDVTLYFNK